jgi:type IV pilus assembly protein PilP
VRVLLLTLAAIVLAATPVAAQPGPAPAQAAPAASAPPPPAPAASQAPPPVSSDSYTYQPDGRRDPFLNLLGTGNQQSATGRKAEGAAGLTVAEIAVSGVLESRGALIAMVQGPDKKTYIVHAGDRLLDGQIRSITPQGLTIVQEVTDPLSLVKQREIQKLLRSLENPKE